MTLVTSLALRERDGSSRLFCDAGTRNREWRTNFGQCPMNDKATQRAALTPLPSRRALIAHLMPYAKPDTPRAITHFLVDFVVYVSGFLIVLFASSLWLKFLGSIIIAGGMGRLFSFAHNAAHENLTRSPPESSARIRGLHADLLQLPAMVL